MTPDDILSFKVGNSAVGENLRRAVESGAIRQHDDGSLELIYRPGNLFLVINRAPPLACNFLNRFMFRQVYAEAAVPAGCEACYKIKVLPRTLRELVAGYEVATAFSCRSKWGIDIDNQHSQSIYAGYCYFSGLEAARALFPKIRKAVDEHPKLGVDVPIVIKRGCSNYEAALGPSDKYTFEPELLEVEAYFKARFRPIKSQPETLASMVYGKWVPFAYRIGDDTYLDFTNGKPLYPKTLSYAP